MSQKTSFYSSLSNRHQKKRGSVDTGIKIDKKYKYNQYREGKKDIAQLTIDLNSQKNTPKILLNRNFTHRPEGLQNNNLCELRQQVEQLRMQNQSLREQIKTLRLSEAQLKNQLGNLKKQFITKNQMLIKSQIQKQKLEQTVRKYSQKIKQLFENLICQKKKNAGINQEYTQVKMALSPSNLSICNSLNLKKHQNQGFTDYYNSTKKSQRKQQNYKQQYSRMQNNHKIKKIGWSLESSESSMSGFRCGQNFVNKY